MPADPKPPLTDAVLDRLARGWFAEARARAREDEQGGRPPRSAERGAGDGDGSLFDWLFGDGAADDGACDDGACDDGGGDSD